MNARIINNQEINESCCCYDECYDFPPKIIRQEKCVEIVLREIYAKTEDSQKKEPTKNKCCDQFVEYFVGFHSMIMVKEYI